MTEREVVYKLRVAPDDRNAQVMQKFIEAVRRAENTVVGVKATSQERAAKDAEKARIKTERDAQRAADKAVKEAEREAKARVREAEKANKQIEKERERSLKKQAADQEKANRLAEKESARSLRQMQAEHENANRRIMASNSIMRESIMQAGEGLMKFGRGLAMIGVVGEEDTKKVLEQLIKIQAAIDILGGSVKIYHALTNAVQAYRSALAAAAVSQAALNALQARGAVATAGAASASAGATAASVAGTAAAGAGLAGAGGAGAGGTGAAATAGVGGAATVGLFVAALASAGAALKVLWETVSGSADEVDSWTNKIAESEVKVTKWFAKFLPEGMQLGTGGIIASEKAIAATEAQGAATRGRLGREELVRQSQLEAGGYDYRETSMRDRYGRLGDASTPRQRLDLISREQSRVSDYQASLGSRQETTDTGIKAQMDAQIEAAEYAASLAQDRLRTEREIGQERRSVVREELDKAKENLSLTKEKLKSEKEALMSAEERFGQLNELEQKRLLEIGRKAQANPDALSREERAALRGVGLSSTTATARRGDIAAAERAGFSTVFGAEERAKVQGLEKQQKEFEISVKDKRELIVQIDREEDEIAKRAAQAIAFEIAKRDEILVEKIRQAEERAMMEINRLTNEQAAQRAGLVGRR